jgi:hypothetical protein
MEAIEAEVIEDAEEEERVLAVLRPRDDGSENVRVEPG